MYCAIGEAHRRYTRHINFQKDWKGHLWQGRFASFPMDEAYLITTVRYIELNPVKTGPLLAVVGNWQELLASDLAEQEYERLHRHERSGRPLGDDAFLAKLEKMTSRVLRKQQPGPKKK